MKNKTVRLIILILLLTGLGGYLFTQRHELLAQLDTLDKKPSPSTRRLNFDAPYRDEAGWIIHSILTDIYGMIVYQARAGVVDYNALSIQVARHFADGKSGFADENPVYQIRAVLPELDEPVELSINFANGDLHIWSPEYYWDWTRMLIDLLVPELPANFSDPAVYLSVYRHLADPRSEVIERENRNLSRILANNMLDPGANDAAAFLLGVLALREAAGPFSDIRPNLNRMAAHLAVANAVAPAGKENILRSMVIILQDAMINLQVSALERLSRFEGDYRRDPERDLHRIWVDALRTRITGDWRILKNKPHLSPLEKIALFRAISHSISSENALAWIREREEHQIPFNEAARIVAETSYSVGLGHVFMQNSIGVELQELTTILQNPSAELANQNLLIGYLNRQGGRAVDDSPSGGTAVKVIPDGLWAGFFQRHLMNRLRNEYLFYQKYLGREDLAEEFLRLTEQNLSELHRYPVFACMYTHRAGDLEAALAKIREAMVKTPEIFTRRWWLFHRSTLTPKQPSYDLAAKYEVFYRDVTPGTLYDLKPHHMEFNLRSGRRMDLMRKIIAEAPYQRRYLSRYLRGLEEQKSLTEKELVQTLGAITDFNIYAMVRVAKWYEASTQTDKAITAYARLCSLDPDYYFTLGDLLVKIGRETEAAEAFQKGWDLSTNTVLAANNCQWLVGYYYANNKKEQALAMARRAAETYSQGGLWTMADLLEKMSDLAGAEQYYRKIFERYRDPGDLVGFYRRHRKDGRYQTKCNQLLATLFPKSMQRAALDEFSGQPTAGVSFGSTTQAMRRHGLWEGDIIVAMDGYRVENEAQYWALVNYREHKAFSLIVWQKRGYKKIQIDHDKRYLNSKVETYTGT